jgi:hypothetical protein
MKIERKSSLVMNDPLVVTIIVIGVIVVCSIVIYAIRATKRDKKEKKEEKQPQPELTGYPFRITKSVGRDDASQAKNELRLLDLERGILSDAIRRLYEAHAEGKISEEERERLAQSYKSRMMTIKDAISKDESLVALHELETMQEDLMKLFSERFDELTTKIDEMRSKAQTQPIKEITIAPKAVAPQTTVDEEKAEAEGRRKKKRKQAPPKPSQRAEAEKRIEEIRAEVEKVLDKLGQMEIES